MEEESRLNHYETIVIFHEELTEEEYDEKVKEYVHTLIHGESESDSSLTSSIHKIDKMGKKKLAYDVRDCTSGWYLMFTHTTSPEMIHLLDKIMRKDDDVIKFMSVRITAEEAIKAGVDLDQVMSEQPEDDKKYKKQIDAFDLIFGKI